nr:interaptin-like [Onthophagus taurus]
MSETDDTNELVLIPPDFFSCELPFFEENRYFDVVDNLITQVTNLENRINSIETNSDLSSLTSPNPSFMSSVRKYRSSDDVTETQIKDGFDSTQSTPQKPQTRRVSSSGNFRGRNLNAEGFKQSELKAATLKQIDQYLENNEYFSKNSLNIKDLEFMVQKIENQQKEFDFLSARKESSDLNDTIHSLSSSSGDLTQITTIPNRLAAGSDFVASVSSKTDIRRRTPPDVRHNLRRGTSKNSPMRNNQKKTAHFQRQFTETDTTSTTRGSESSFTQYSERYCNDYQRFYDVSYLKKLDEEKMRRQRCEQLIQQLQKQNFEMQEQLTSAIRVDEAKDDAILRFHKAWEQVAGRLQTLVEERDALESEIKELHLQHTRNFTQAADKMVQQESELKKITLISQTNQEKSKEMENLIVDLTNEIQRLNKKIDELERELKVENDACKGLKDEVERKENELKMVNEELLNAKEKEQQKISDFENEIGKLKNVLKEDKGILTEKDGLIDTLEQQNQKLMTEIDVHKNKAVDLQKDLAKIKETNEKEKFDLKYFYQEQVERVVKEKLLDFQVQLERARGELEDDLKKREVIVAKTAATHIQQIADKHSLEIRLLEEKHSEEVRLYQVQITQAQQLLDNLQYKLQHQQLKKHDMAKQLHKLMEAQWLEALKIINNGRSPLTDLDLTNQLNQLKSKSYNNMEEVLEMGIDEVQEQQTKNSQTNYCQNVPMEPYHMETPLTSRQPKKPDVDDVHKFIHMLMNKQNASPTGDHNQPTRNQTGSVHQVDFAAWQQQEDIRGKTKDKKIKPPWK